MKKQSPSLKTAADTTTRPQDTLSTEEKLRRELARSLSAVYVAIEPFVAPNKKHQKQLKNMSMQALFNDSFDTSTTVRWMTEGGKVPHSISDSKVFEQFATAYAAAKAHDDAKWAIYTEHTRPTSPKAIQVLGVHNDLKLH